MRIVFESRSVKLYGQPGVYDLTAFSRRLPGGRDFKKLKGIIRRLSSSGSSVEDLEIARKYLAVAKAAELLATSEKAQPDQTEMDVITALTSWSIVIYSRATGTSSRARDPQNIIEHLTDDERNMHRTLRGLRDDALAHFGGGPNTDQPWSKDAVVLCTRPNDEVAIYTPVVRTGFRADVSASAEHMVSRAIAIVTSFHSQQKRDFWDEYESLARQHSWIIEALQACPWDHTAFYADPRAGAFAEGMMTGQTIPTAPIYRPAVPFGIDGLDEKTGSGSPP